MCEVADKKRGVKKGGAAWVGCQRCGDLCAKQCTLRAYLPPAKRTPSPQCAPLPRFEARCPRRRDVAPAPPPQPAEGPHSPHYGTLLIRNPPPSSPWPPAPRPPPNQGEPAPAPAVTTWPRTGRASRYALRTHPRFLEAFHLPAGYWLALSACARLTCGMSQCGCGCNSYLERGGCSYGAISLLKLKIAE